MVLVAIALSVLACSRTDPGISREKAEAILRAFDFADIELQPSPENGRRSGKEGQMLHYYAIAERGSRTTWWISFPGRDGITSAADDAGQIVVQAQDALASAAMDGGRLPPAIEDGATPPTDLSEFNQPANGRRDPVRRAGGSLLNEGGARLPTMAGRSRFIHPSMLP
jgi:hypothetical protein